MRYNKSTEIFKMQGAKKLYILLKNLTFFKKDKMFSADTSPNKSFRLLLLKSDRLSIAKSAQSSKMCFTVKGV